MHDTFSPGSSFGALRRTRLSPSSGNATPPPNPKVEKQKCIFNCNYYSGNILSQSNSILKRFSFKTSLYFLQSQSIMHYMFGPMYRIWLSGLVEIHLPWEDVNYPDCLPVRRWSYSRHHIYARHNHMAVLQLEAMVPQLRQIIPGGEDLQCPVWKTQLPTNLFLGTPPWPWQPNISDLAQQ